MKNRDNYLSIRKTKQKKKEFESKSNLARQGGNAAVD